MVEPEVVTLETLDHNPPVTPIDIHQPGDIGARILVGAPSSIAGRMLVSSMGSYPIANGSSILPPATMMPAYPALLNLKDELITCTGLSHSGRLHLPCKQEGLAPREFKSRTRP